MKEEKEEKDKLYSQIGRLKVEVDWLKKNRTSRLSPAEKIIMIEPGHSQLSVVRQRVMGVRSYI